MFLRPTIQRWSLNRSVLRSHGLLFHSLCECVGVCFAGHPCFSDRAEFKGTEGLRSHIFGIKVLDLTVGPSRLQILGIQHATARMLSLASILVPPLFFAHSHSSLFASCCGSSVLGKQLVVAGAFCFWQTSSIKIIAFFASPSRISSSALYRQTLSIRYPRYRYPPRSTEHIPWSCHLCSPTL